jgi:Reverse transcriptase (RNA-dependent DNA polymerase)
MSRPQVPVPPLQRQSGGKLEVTKCVHGVISPLLANLYLNSLDHGVNDQPELNAKLVRYADDFVLLCRPGNGAALYQRLKAYLQRKGLKLTPRFSVNDLKGRLITLQERRQLGCGLEFAEDWPDAD